MVRGMLGVLLGLTYVTGMSFNNNSGKKHVYFFINPCVVPGCAEKLWIYLQNNFQRNCKNGYTLVNSWKKTRIDKGTMVLTMTQI